MSSNLQRTVSRARQTHLLRAPAVFSSPGGFWTASYRFLSHRHSPFSRAQRDSCGLAIFPSFASSARAPRRQPVPGSLRSLLARPSRSLALRPMLSGAA